MHSCLSASLLALSTLISTTFCQIQSMSKVPEHGARATFTERPLLADFRRSSPGSMLIKSGAKDWSVRMQSRSVRLLSQPEPAAR
ncbi:hypothetical protein SAMN04490180_5452 [Pseudomonas brassicacearum]|nr:hypothetical protein SAMN04490180_5452 [Pseudomonas brassicacearum]